jgi:hypothetical protein
MLLVTVAALGIVYYLIVALNTGDPLWLRSDFNGQPIQFVIHCYGQDVVLGPASPAYASLNQAINQALSGPKRWDTLTLSDTTYQDYLSSPEMMVLAVDYSPPVRVHSAVKYFANVETMLIPLDGRHAQYNVVFGRNRGLPTAGSMYVESTSQITEIIAGQGLCLKP